VDAQLSIQDLTLSFGAVRALDGISLDVRAGSIHAIIGPNGAGKTSLLNCISRVYQPSSGSIGFAGHDVTRLPRHALASAGIARTFQNIALFKAMTVLDNVLIGHHSRMSLHPLAGAQAPLARRLLDLAGGAIEPLASSVYFGPIRRREKRHRAEVDEVIAFLELQDVRHRIVGGLPYGVQKRVDLARALAARPSLLLLDEPTAGMTTSEKEVMVRFIRETNGARGVTVVLIEHDMSVVMGLSREITVLDFGRKIMTGTPAEVRVHPRVIEAYLGEEIQIVDDGHAVPVIREPVTAGEEP
jgi:branched-chain amino acid transport system ATP-binding protein